jgi:hypothetical protein
VCLGLIVVLLAVPIADKLLAAPVVWEYAVQAIVDDVPFAQQMDAIGSAGWELVSLRRFSNRVLDAGAGPSGIRTVTGYEAVFKRRK